MVAEATSKVLINPTGALPEVIRGITIRPLTEAEPGNLPHLLQVFQDGADGADKATNLGQVTHTLHRRIFHRGGISKPVDTLPLLHPPLSLPPSRVDRLSTPTALASIAMINSTGTIGTAPPTQTTGTMTVTTIVTMTAAEALVMAATGAAGEVETLTGVEVTAAICGGDDLVLVYPFYGPVVAIPKREPIVGAGLPVHHFHLREWFTHAALISFYFFFACQSLCFLSLYYDTRDICYFVEY